ncbi:photosystem II reaction center PsbP family protein [Striga asiatica]|uniref:Photosystem II reaction center PsbP family protein n=1 Tax=Striga asiatica TaxID=4170 RepID=A0A5A7Q0C5_STRAF|nr:photosystem II reaction center PsbP family protein [Striga asiatica]
MDVEAELESRVDFARVGRTKLDLPRKLPLDVLERTPLEERQRGPSADDCEPKLVDARRCCPPHGDPHERDPIERASRLIHEESGRGGTRRCLGGPGPQLEHALPCGACRRHAVGEFGHGELRDKRTVSVASSPLDQLLSEYVKLYVHLLCGRLLIGHFDGRLDEFRGHRFLHDMHWIHVRSVPVDIMAETR